MYKILYFLCFSITLSAQPDSYVFSILYNVPYTKLESPTVITTAGWDDFDAEVPLGFDFRMMGRTTNTLYFDAEMFNIGTDLTFSKNTTFTHIYSTLLDLVDRSDLEPDQYSTVSYKSQKDQSGKNFTTIQWDNCGLLEKPGDSLNMQMKFYENRNTLEYHFGISSYEGIEEFYKNEDFIGSKGPFIVIGKNVNFFNSNSKLYFTESTSPPKMDSTTIGEIEDLFPNLGLDSFPRANTIFRWSIPITNQLNITKLDEEISIYPTIVQDILNLEIKDKFDIIITNSHGQNVMNQKAGPQINQVNVTDLKPGFYNIRFSNDKKIVSYKFQKV